MSGTK